MKDTPTPYRDSDNPPPAPLEELEWRQRVGKAALWAEELGVGGALVLLVTILLPARFAMQATVAWLVMGGALVVATWMYTVPRPHSVVGWRPWLLRVGVSLCLGVTGLPLLGVHLVASSYTLGALLLVAGLAYMWPFRRTPRRRSRREVRVTVLCMVALAATLQILGPKIDFLGFCVVLAASLCAWALRDELLPVRLRWWFDSEAKPPGEWVALLVYRDERAQVLFIDDRPGWIAPEALLALEDNGYVPAERALAEHLVDRVPPDVLSVARRSQRVRAGTKPLRGGSSGA